MRRRPAASLLGLACAGPALAASQRPETLLTVEARDPFRLPGSGTLRVEGRIAAGYHVNSHTPSEDYLIPTVVRVSPAPGLTAAEPKYPAGEMKKFAFADRPLSVYAGRFASKCPSGGPVPVRPPRSRATSTSRRATTRSASPPPRSLSARSRPAAPAAAAALAGGAIPLSGRRRRPARLTIRPPPARRTTFRDS